MKLGTGLLILIFFTAGVAVTKELARQNPNSLMIERSPKADRQ